MWHGSWQVLNPTGPTTKSMSNTGTWCRSNRVQTWAYKRVYANGAGRQLKRSTTPHPPLTAYTSLPSSVESCTTAPAKSSQSPSHSVHPSRGITVSRLPALHNVHRRGGGGGSALDDHDGPQSDAQLGDVRLVTRLHHLNGGSRGVIGKVQGVKIFRGGKDVDPSRAEGLGGRATLTLKKPTQKRVPSKIKNAYAPSQTGGPAPVA